RLVAMICYAWLDAGESALNLFRNRGPARCLAVGVLFVALCLAGCGRKGGLDPPPAAAIVDQTVAAPAEVDKPPLGPDGRPLSPPPPARRSLIDWLID